jgi:hypothetical protein
MPGLATTSPLIRSYEEGNGGRQFQREARLFRPAELGRYAGLLTDNGSSHA